MVADPLHVDDETDEQVLEALAHDRRRHAFVVLREAQRPLSLTELAVELARREADHGKVGPRSEPVERIRITLYHCHLPKLSDANLVDFDVGERTAEAVETDTIADRLPLQRVT